MASRALGWVLSRNVQASILGLLPRKITVIMLEREPVQIRDQFMRPLGSNCTLPAIFSIYISDFL